MSELYTVTVKLKVTQELLDVLGGVSKTPAGVPALEVSDALPRILKRVAERNALTEPVYVKVGDDLTVTTTAD